MTKYRKRDVGKLRKFIDGLKESQPKDNYPVNMTKLGNLLDKLGFVEYVQSGSKRPFVHDLLIGCPGFLDGRFLMTEAHGKRDVIHWRNFEDHCLTAIEYVLMRIEAENLIIEDDDKNE
jgi:hypothetical protein